MQEILEKLFFYFHFPFVVNAIIVGSLIALCCALIGVPLVLKRFSFIGDSLSHVAFGALTIATIMQFSNNMFVVLFITIIFSIILFKTSENKKINADAATAIVSVGALGIGYLLMNLFAKSANLSGDVCTILFGSTSILTLKKSEVILCIILSISVIFLFILFYNRIFAITFDESFSKGIGFNTNLYNIIIAVVIAVIISLAMKLVGSLLISALLIFPALSSMRFCKSFKSVTIFAGFISIFCSLFGIILAILLGTPVGATIVTTEVVVFIFFYIFGILIR